jgi:hypothetical protein
MLIHSSVLNFNDNVILEFKIHVSMLARTFGILKVVRINRESVEDICEASSRCWDSPRCFASRRTNVSYAISIYLQY